MSATLHRDTTQRVLRALTIGLIAAVAVVPASCGGGSGGKGKVVEIVVPAGTQDKLDRGEIVDIMPAELYFRIGDVLRIRNNDRAAQYVGPYVVQAGEQFELKYGATGSYGGLCNLSGGNTYKIVITA
ncbi:MAG TPA: hypothetical protein VH761_02600 [Ilumatobacteraceae bacterium]|jgi:hypothetical protein